MFTLIHFLYVWIMPDLQDKGHDIYLTTWHWIRLQASEWDSARQEAEWEELRKRCLITNHPLYSEMLANHAACLRVGTPVDQLASIEAQLAQAPNVTEKYRGLRDQIADISPEEQAELDRFMVRINVPGFSASISRLYYTG